MAGKLASVALVIAAIGLPLQMAPAAHAEVTIDTKPVIPSANGLVCTVVNGSQKPMGITAQIIDEGINVTDFITTNWLDATAGILASVVSRSRPSGSLLPDHDHSRPEARRHLLPRTRAGAVPAGAVTASHSRLSARGSGTACRTRMQLLDHAPQRGIHISRSRRQHELLRVAIHLHAAARADHRFRLGCHACRSAPTTPGRPRRIPPSPRR